MAGFLGTGQALTGARRKPLQRSWAGAAMLLIAAPVLACLNTQQNGIKEAHGRGDTAALLELRTQAEGAHGESPTIENTNDLAVAWILTGRVDDAIRLLREFEKNNPGNARIAANLGTALELSGDDQEALLWIRESVRRDPDEHAGSEWVHVKILEAKLKLKKDRNWLRIHSVVGWREDEQLRADEHGRVRSPADLIAPITYQLKERTRFVQPPDEIVGDLYLTLGDIAHSTSAAYRNAWERDDQQSFNYASALRYGTVHEVRARDRMEAADRRIEASRDERRAVARRAADARAQTALRLERKRMDEQRRLERKQEQQRRRQLAVWVFVSLGLVVTAVIFWRRRRAPA